MNKELVDNKIHIYNENNENHKFSMLYDRKDYFMDFEMYLTNSHGNQVLTDKFKLAFTDLSNLTGGFRCIFKYF